LGKHFAADRQGRPQARLVSNNPCEGGDIAGLSRRARPGTCPAKPAIDWPTLRQLASIRSAPALI
jgi:hypothetical protein